jgi:hypothetical protein
MRDTQLRYPEHLSDLPKQRDDLGRLLRARLGVGLLPNPDDLLKRDGDEPDLALQQGSVVRVAQPRQLH